MAKTVLIVEDDSAVADYLEVVLIAQGYTVLVAGSIEVAHELLSLHNQELSCVVTDGMGPLSQPGLALAEKVHALNPALPVILVSGNLQPLDWREQEKERFLPKPFTRRELLAVMQEVETCS